MIIGLYAYAVFYYFNFLPFQFEEVFEETKEALTAALSTQHYGVIHALTLACHRLTTKQASCMKV